MHILGGKLKNQAISSPASSHTRPTSSRLRETLFNIVQGYIEDALFLDLFAGTGAMGLEAISRGALSCTFVDNNQESMRCIQKNLEKMKIASQGKTIMGNVFSWTEKLAVKGPPFTIIYADPPYEKGLSLPQGLMPLSQQILNLVDRLPILEAGGVLFIEDSSHFKPDISSLQTLELFRSRASGKSTLLQFTKR